MVLLHQKAQCLPLALLVPLSQTKKDWQKVLNGLLLGFAGIGILALLSNISGTTHWQFKLPSHIAARTWRNLVLNSIYLLSGRIESAIFTHFPLNFFHMTSFEYHADVRILKMIALNLHRQVTCSSFFET